MAARNEGALERAHRRAEGEVAQLIAVTAKELRSRVRGGDMTSATTDGLQALAQLVTAFYGEDGVPSLGDDDDGEDDEGEE